MSTEKCYRLLDNMNQPIQCFIGPSERGFFPPMQLNSISWISSYIIQYIANWVGKESVYSRSIASVPYFTEKFKWIPEPLSTQNHTINNCSLQLAKSSLTNVCCLIPNRCSHRPFEMSKWVASIYALGEQIQNFLFLASPENIRVFGSLPSLQRSGPSELRSSCHHRECHHSHTRVLPSACSSPSLIPIGFFTLILLLLLMFPAWPPLARKFAKSNSNLLPP